MLRTLEHLLSYHLLARDGEIGRVYDFFFDDMVWKLRYVVVETGSWLDRRRVLIAPTAIDSIDGNKREFLVNLTREQVQQSPDIDTEKPVSRQEELQMNEYYGWPAYWIPEAPMMEVPVLVGPPPARPREGNPHLRSFRELSRYHVSHGHRVVARVHDMVIDDESWALQSVIAAVGGWLDSRQVAVPVDAIHDISWTEETVVVKLSKADLEQLPVFDPNAPVNHITRLVYFDYRGRPIDNPTPPGGE